MPKKKESPPVPKAPPKYPRKIHIGEGRPMKYDLEVVAQELLAYARNGAKRLRDFTFDKPYLPEQLNRWAMEHPETFGLAYKKSMMIIASNRDELLDKEELNYGAWMKYSSFYDAEINAFERAQKAYDASLRNQTDAAHTGPFKVESPGRNAHSPTNVQT